MNIAFFTNSYTPFVSGVVNSTSLFKSGLEQAGHNVYVFAPRYSGFIDKEKHVYRFRSVSLTNKVNYPLPSPYSMRYFKLIYELKLDIIHAQHPFLLGETASYFSKKLQIPLFYTFHTQFEQYSHYIPLNQKLVKYLAKTSVINYIKKCDCVITPSGLIKKVLENYGVDKRIEVIPNAIEVERFKNADPVNVRKKYNIPKDDIVFIFVGRIAAEKNLRFLMDSFKIIYQNIKNVSMMIVGDGPQLGELKKYAVELGISKKTVFTGNIDYSNIADYYCACDIFTITSVTEVKPLAILEALAGGLCIAGIDAPGASDTVTSGYDGILTKLDVNAFSHEIVKLCLNPSVLKKMKHNASLTSERYSINGVTQKLISIYELYKR